MGHPSSCRCRPSRLCLLRPCPTLTTSSEMRRRRSLGLRLRAGSPLTLSSSPHGSLSSQVPQGATALWSSLRVRIPPLCATTGIAPSTRSLYCPRRSWLTLTVQEIPMWVASWQGWSKVCLWKLAARLVPTLHLRLCSGVDALSQQSLITNCELWQSAVCLHNHVSFAEDMATMAVCCYQLGSCGGSMTEDRMSVGE